MCKLKSGIILKNRVFIPEYDSHLENATFKDRYAKTIYQAGNWKLVSVESEGKING